MLLPWQLGDLDALSFRGSGSVRHHDITDFYNGMVGFGIMTLYLN